MAESWSGNRVRSTFLEFFESKGHTVVPSSSVVPHADPTLLFANAGMNQFKPIFLGTVDPKSDFAKMKRATDSQKCIRAGGKHNDLDDVGKDVYHHTFFEMLGNWSFGDYFKHEAIRWAWELLTEVYKMDQDRLYATYFGGDKALGLEADEEAREIWCELLPKDRVLPFGCKDNFWEMGDQGPCGPCSEIHYDRIGSRDAGHLVNKDDPNVLEIWNLVFIQYDRQEGGSLKPLPSQHVDTGMGMERVTSVLQSKDSNYATDIFTPIFKAIHAVSHDVEEYTDKVGEEDKGNKDMAYRVVADHIRTLSFAIADGARPGNEGREYVLRRVLRRAVRYGKDILNCKPGFIATLVESVVSNFGDFYPELSKKQTEIHNVIKEEETAFSKTLDKGIELFEKRIRALDGGKTLSGEDAFQLYDTFGFPLDLTQRSKYEVHIGRFADPASMLQLMAEEQHVDVDLEGFERCMKEQKERGRKARKTGGREKLKFEAEATSHLSKSGVPTTDDKPKYTENEIDAKIAAILTSKGFQETTEGIMDSVVGIVLDRTPFYAEQGGQVADIGRIASSSGVEYFEVQDTQVAAGYVLHIGEVQGILNVGDTIKARIDCKRRYRIAANHTMTHIMNYALREVLGDHIDQKGSIVLPDKLRFDFTHSSPICAEDLRRIEHISLQIVEAKMEVFTEEVPLAQAREIAGLRAVFGEVYPDPVRVVSVGKPIKELLADPGNKENRNYSVEFCGGTHVEKTNRVGRFVLVSEEGIAKGVRRIVALSGAEARDAITHAKDLSEKLRELNTLEGAELETQTTAFKVAVDAAMISSPDKAMLREGISKLQKKILETSKMTGQENKRKAIEAALEAARACESSRAGFLVTQLDVGLDTKAVQEAYKAVQDTFSNLPSLFISADMTGKKKALVLGGVPEKLIGTLQAGEWVKATLAPLGGKCGMNEKLSQGQGPNIDKVPEALEAAKAYAVSQMKAST